ncbi:MAG: TonB-dependent receptor [Gammaproteobacteria bacterium]|nr:TonB-dependent receptor [Gammaproteobacteria bacterium]
MDRIVAVLVLGILCQAVVQAEDRAAGGETILFQDIPAVYGASKYEQKLSEAPAAVSIITADEIDKYGYRTLADVLRSVTGVYTSSDRSYTYAGVRGFQRPGDYNGRILLLIDGYRINDNIFDQAFLGNESIVDVDTIDRVEIIRGPGSSLYGTNAFFATINVITKRGRDLKGGEVTGEAGSFHSYKGRVAYGNKYDSGLETLLAVSGYDSRGQSFFYPEFNNPATNNGIARDVDREQYKNLFAKFSSGDYILTAGYVSRDKVLPTGVFGTVFNDPATRITDPQLGFVNLKFEHDLTDASRLMLRAGYNSYYYQGEYLYSAGLTRENDYGHWWLTEAQLTQTLSARQRLVVGVEQQNNTRQDQNSYDFATNTTLLEDHRTSKRHAFYLQDEYRLRDDLLVNAGVRYDKYDSFGGTTNPRLGLIYSATDKTTLKLLYGKAFRAPNVYESYYSDAGSSTPTHKGNANLKPETVETWEFVVEQSLRSGLRSAVSLYRYEIRDLITQQTDAADGLEVFNNANKIHATGMEFELEGKLASRLDGRASYAVQESKDAVSGEVLTNSPRHLAKLNLNTPVIERKVFAGLEVLGTSRRKTVAGNYANGFALVNATLFSRQWIKGFEASAGVYNLFDRHYGDPVSADFTQDTIEQDGRTYRLKMKYEF